MSSLDGMKRLQRKSEMNRWRAESLETEPTELVERSTCEGFSERPPSGVEDRVQGGQLKQRQ